jgi:hypothetical protein
MVFRALPKHLFAMKISIASHFLFFLDKKKEAKKVKASCRYQVQYSPISAMPYRTIFTLVRHFSIRYGHVGEGHDGSHFLYLFRLPKFDIKSILRKGKAVGSAFAHRFLICSMG